MEEPREIEYFGSPVPRTLSARQVKSRNAVLTAAADAFNTRGYAATSIDDIADRLGSTKGRIYHYFRTKGEIFIGILRQALEMSRDAVAPAAAADAPAPERLRRMAEAHARLMMDKPAFMRLALQGGEVSLAGEGRTRQEDIDHVLTLRREYNALFTKVIAEGIAQGEFAEAEPELQSLAVLGALNGMSEWYDPRTDGDETRKATIATTMARFVTGGLLPIEALRY